MEEKKLVSGGIMKMGSYLNYDTSEMVELWDEKGHSDIFQILLWHNRSEIHAVQFQYLGNGMLVMSDMNPKKLNLYAGRFGEGYFHP